MVFIYLFTPKNEFLNPENKSTIQNHAIKLYSKIKIIKKENLRKLESHM